MRGLGEEGRCDVSCDLHSLERLCPAPLPRCLPREPSPTSPKRYRHAGRAVVLCYNLLSTANCNSTLEMLCKFSMSKWSTANTNLLFYFSYCYLSWQKQIRAFALHFHHLAVPAAAPRK